MLHQKYKRPKKNTKTDFIKIELITSLKKFSATLGQVKRTLAMCPRTPSLRCSFKWDRKLHWYKEPILSWSWTPTQLWKGTNHGYVQYGSTQIHYAKMKRQTAFWEKHHHTDYKQMYVHMGQEWGWLPWSSRRKLLGVMELLRILAVLGHIFLYESIEPTTLKWIFFFTVCKLPW